MKEAVGLLARRALSLAMLLAVLCASVLLFGEEGAVTVWADAASGVRLPILMYHSVLKDPQRAGEYVISPVQLEEDLRYLKKNGYTPVLPADLVRYASGEGELPEQPVMITFDDGHYNNLVYVLPILKRLNMKAVISVVGAFTERAAEQMDQNPAYAHLVWEDIRTLSQSGLVEIGSHSYGLHSSQNGRQGVRRKAWESEEAHALMLRADIQKQREALFSNCGVSMSTFAYPFGYWDHESEAILREEGFAVTLTCRERMNYIERDPASLFHLGRFNRPSGLSTWEFMHKALKN